MSDRAPTGSSPRRIRQANIVAALQSLYLSRGASRAELARALRMNRSSSGEIVAALTGGGYVRETGGRETGGRLRAGRPGIMLELVPDAALFIGLEIGVEHLAAVVIDMTARILLRRKQAFDTPAATVDDAVANGLAMALEAMEPGMIDRCRGLGIATPAHIRVGGVVAIAPLIGWRDVPLGEIARAAVPRPMPVTVENDANAFAIGDGYRNGGAGVTLFLLIETGVGGGVLIDGRLFRGGHGLAGEIGHTRVPCGGGRPLEALIGREALVAQYRAATGQDGDLAALIAEVRDRVPSAVALAETWSRHLAEALLQARHLIDPDRIVLGGVVAGLYPLVAARVAAHMAAGQSVPLPPVDIVVDAEPDFGSAYGAACLLHQRFLSLDNEEFGAEDGIA
ncbi:ROK family protein [Ensifer soli]|uniref:ROK family protein n=1 Tax=Ciceribacter sp. sgz301302 TaxID=3342379 RepID=UPI0035B8D67D